jgi:hypothetical protein
VRIPVWGRGKLWARNSYPIELSKILEEFPDREEEYPAKLLPAIRNTNCFIMIL